MDVYKMEPSAVFPDQYVILSGKEMIAKGLTREAASTIVKCVNAKSKIVSLLEKVPYTREEDRTEAQEILKELYVH